MNELVLPDWVTSLWVPENQFAHAYEFHSPEQRAWLKKNISQLYTWYAKYAYTYQQSNYLFQSGLKSAIAQKRLDWALFVLEDSFLSPAQLLAAVMPAVMSQVPEIMVARLSSVNGWTDSQLLALELAGVENVFVFDLSQLNEFSADLRSWSSNGGLFLLEGPENNLFFKAGATTDSGLVKWCGRDEYRAGLWWDNNYNWDCHSLAWAQPNLSVAVWGAQDFQVQLPQKWTKRTGSWDEFLNSGYDILYVSSFEQAQTALQTFANLCLGPGQEVCWLWPDLGLSNFLSQSICWSD
jgi:hypothetical protein